jgi:nicotinamide riboside transporter PnuC
MIWLECLGLVSAVLSVLGCILNNRKLAACFPLWLVSNGICVVLHSVAGLWTLVGRDVVFIVLAVDGWRKWKGTTHE